MQQNEKCVTLKKWKAMKIVAPASETSAQIRIDENGQKWIWVTKIRKVIIKRVM